MIQHSHFGENSNLKRYMDLHVHSSPIYSSKACKPPKCPLTDAWIKNTCTHTHKYTME